MKLSAKLIPLLMLAVLVFVPAQTAAAKGQTDGQVFFAQTVTVKSGETFNGDLVVFGGSATIEAGGTVNGNAVVFGGNLVVNGDVTGDAAIVGGSMSLGASAHVHGNLSTVGASLNRADGSQVDGQVFNAATAWGRNGIGSSPTVVIPPVVPNIKVESNPLWSLGGAVASAFGQAALIALLAMVLMLFLAPHADRVAHAILAQPLTAGGLGLLTTILVPIAFLTLAVLSVLIVTLVITVPVMIILGIALAMAVIFGWIAIGYEVGQRLTRAFHQEWHPAFSAGLGTFIMTLVVNGASVLNFLPGLECVTWILPTVVVVFALGAVLMTRFGTQLVAAPAVVPPAPAGQNPAK